MTEPMDVITVYDTAFIVAAFLVSGGDKVDSSEQYEECFKIVRRLIRCVTNKFIDMQSRSIDWEMKPIDYLMADESETSYERR